MKKLLAIILTIHLMLGGYLVMCGGNLLGAPAVLQSDFRVFAKRVAMDESAAHVLEYGGEIETETYSQLVDKIGELRNGWEKAYNAGKVLTVSSVIGLVVLARWKPREILSMNASAEE